MEDTNSEVRNIRASLQDLEAISLTESLPEKFPIEETNPFRGRLKKFVTTPNHRISTILCIITGSIFGVLARKGIIALTSYDGAIIEGVAWANYGACLIMGIAIGSSKLWEGLIKKELYENKGKIPLYVGITTGFCGTFSSFSTAIEDIFLSSANVMPDSTHNYPNPAYGIMVALAGVIAHFSISVAGFHMGHHLIDFTDRYFPTLTRKQYKILETAIRIIGIACFIIIIVLISVKDHGSWRSWMFSCLFAPFGALLRYYLSKYLNQTFQDFPLGTFSANMIGTTILSICTLLIRGKRIGNHSISIVNNVLQLHVLNGVGDGFCGALTTVSTFVAELFGLKTAYSYKYALSSIVLGYAIFVLVVGSYNWKVGLL